MKTIRIFLTDWQILFREGVHLTLAAEGGYEVIGEAVTAVEAVDFIKSHQPEVAILNADHGEFPGIKVTRCIKQSLPAVAIILMMDNYCDEQVFAALKSGASACLSKDVRPIELLETIRKVIYGEYPISQYILKPQIASRILGEFEHLLHNNKEKGTPPIRLVYLETQILNRITDGSLLSEIARDLNITEDIVRQRLYVILGKLVANERRVRY